MKVKEACVLLGALFLGVALLAIASRPGFDDTGVMAGAVFAAAFVLATFAPRIEVGIGFLVGSEIMLAGFANQDYGSAWALAVSLGAALIGGAVGRKIVTASQSRLGLKR